MASMNPGASKPPTQITISIDETELRRASDENLALYWHVAQANPVPITDKAAGELAMRIGWEIIRRWLGQVEPPLYHHQQSHYHHLQLTKFARFVDGEWQAKEPADEIHAVCPDGVGAYCGAAHGSRTTLLPNRITCPDCKRYLADDQAPADAAPPRLAELRAVHAPELHIDMQVCTACSEKQQTPVRWPCAPLRQAEVELGGPKVRTEVRRTHFGTKDSEHGRVCAGCSKEQGVPILWPCLLLRAVDRIEGVAHADSGLLETPAPTANLKHALMPDGAEQPRCGARQGSRFAMLAENVTCPECRHLLEEQLAGYGTNDPDDETESTITEPPGDAP